MARDTELQRELLSREREYWQAIKERDAGAATRLSDASCIVVGAQGVSELSRQALAGMLENAAYELRDFGLRDVQFRRLGEDVAVLAYRVDEELVVDGKKVELKAFDSSVWMQRDGEWVCVLHTESPAGDPFGRSH